MIRIYQDFEFPRGYIDTIRLNDINLLDVRWIIDSDGRNYGIASIAEKLGRYRQLDTITDHIIYVIYW